MGQIDDDLSYFFLKIVFVVKDLERQEVNGLKRNDMCIYNYRSCRQTRIGKKHVNNRLGKERVRDKNS